MLRRTIVGGVILPIFYLPENRDVVSNSVTVEDAKLTNENPFAGFQRSIKFKGEVNCNIDSKYDMSKGQWTISCWAKGLANGSSGLRSGHNNVYVIMFGFNFFYSNKKPCWLLCDNYWGTLINKECKSNEWYYFEMTKDDNHYKFFLNGEFADEKTSAGGTYQGLWINDEYIPICHVAVYDCILHDKDFEVPDEAYYRNIMRYCKFAYTD